MLCRQPRLPFNHGCQRREKVKNTGLIITWLLLSSTLFGQSTTSSDAEHLQFNVLAGLHYKTFLDKTYIDPELHQHNDDFAEHQYERFNKVPTFGFRVGFGLDYGLSEHWGLSTGLAYVLRKDVFENNRDTVIRYGSFSAMRNISNVVKYDYVSNDIQIPFLLKYSADGFTFYAGIHLSVFAYKKAAYTYVINQYPIEPNWTTSEKTVSGFEIPLKVFPTLQSGYKVNVGNLEFNPFLAVLYEINAQNDIYIQTGILVPLAKIR